MIIMAKVPVYTFKDYHMRRMNITSSKGCMKARMVGYEPCCNADEVIAEIGYEKVTDDEYSSASIFCSKGKGYTVAWGDAEDHMHCLK